MGFVKGKSGNPLGRPKNAKNRMTGKSRELIQCFCEGYIEQIRADFALLEPKERIKFFIDLLPFFLPKYTSIEMNANVDADVTQKKEMYEMISQQYAFSSIDAAHIYGKEEDEESAAEEACKVAIQSEGGISALCGMMNNN